MPINVTVIAFINFKLSYYPFSYFNTLKVTYKKNDNINNPINNKVTRDWVPKLLKTLSLS